MTMEYGLISEMFFGRLYPSEEYSKIDLFSSTFLGDALAFYCKKANENEREGLIKGIELLAHRIKEIDEINEVNRTWRYMASTRSLRIGIEEGRRKQDLALGKPNLARKFENEVSNILEIRQTEILENKIKEEARRKKKLEDLRKKSENDKNLIDSLIIANQNISQAISVSGKVDLTNLLLNVKKDRDNVTRNKAENILSQLSKSRADPKRLKGNEFTAIASMLYRTGWIVKKMTFADWLRAFSEAYQRPTPRYKETQVKVFIESVIIKAPFLKELPFMD